MVVFPQLFSKVKLILLLLSLISIFLDLNNKPFFYSKVWLSWFSFYFLFYFLWITYGVLKGNPGISDYIRLQIIWPVIFFILISSIDSLQKVISLYKLLINFSIIISVYIIYRLLEVINLVPKIYNFEGEILGVGIHSGFIQVVSLSVGSLVFLLPFILCLASGFSKNFLYRKIVSKRKLFIVFILITIAVIISGRRALWFSFFITYILIFLTNFLIYKRNFTKLIYNFSLFSIILFFIGFTSITYLNDKVDFDQLSNRITKEFNSAELTPRQLQSIALFKGFKKNPLFGSGFGVGVKDNIISSEKPWQYELTYNLYLYNTGLIGMLFFLFLLLFPFSRYLKLCKIYPEFTPYLSPAFISYLIVLFASASNPYFTSSFDFMWMLFLPIAVIIQIEIVIKKNKIEKI
jgi:hypothetical protein